jgi:esterase
MRLFFRTFGSGPVMMILHGLYGSSDNWVSIAKKISKKYTVILPDLRNHGQSPHSDVHTYDLMAEDIFSLACELGLDSFILAGHSMGGRAAMRYALRWPEMIATLVVADISPFGPPSKESIFYTQHKEILETILSVRSGEFKSRKAVEEKLAIGITSEKIRGFIMKNLGRNDQGTLDWRLNAKALLNNLWNITSGIAGEDSIMYPVTGFPVIFMKGENSEYLEPDDYPKIREIFPAAEFILMKDAGHWLHSDRPDLVEEVLLGLY